MSVPVTACFFSELSKRVWFCFRFNREPKTEPAEIDIDNLVQLGAGGGPVWSKSVRQCQGRERGWVFRFQLSVVGAVGVDGAVGDLSSVALAEEDVGAPLTCCFNASSSFSISSERFELLANHFASQMALEVGVAKIPRFSNRALQALRNYGWPGNVRELRNVVERAVYRAEGSEIDEIDLDPFKAPFSVSWEQSDKRALSVSAPERAFDVSTTGVTEHPAPERALSFNDAVVRFECGLLRKALQNSRYNQRQAAAQLGMTYDQFRGLYRKFRTELETD